MLDNESYSDEFLFYMKIKHKIDHGLDEYQGLAQFIKVFSFTTQKIKYFRILARVELDFRGKTQVQLYQFVERQLNSQAHPKVIRDLINQKIEDSIDSIRNEPTKQALISYKKALQSILKEDSGVEFLKILKNNKITNYSIFNVIYSLIKQAKKQDLTNLKGLVLIVKVKQDELEELAKVMNLPQSDNQVIIYAKIIQYITLYYRYQNITFRFEQLLDKLFKWQEHYLKILQLREEYPRHKYLKSAQLFQPLPGESIYSKYEDLLAIE